MPSPDELVEKRRAELLAEGYAPGIVGLALEWAVNSAALYEMVLPTWLRDGEKYLDGLLGAG